MRFIPGKAGKDKHRRLICRLAWRRASKLTMQGLPLSGSLISLLPIRTVPGSVSHVSPKSRVRLMPKPDMAAQTSPALPGAAWMEGAEYESYSDAFCLKKGFCFQVAPPSRET